MQEIVVSYKYIITYFLPLRLSLLPLSSHHLLPHSSFLWLLQLPPLWARVLEWELEACLQNLFRPAARPVPAANAGPVQQQKE